MTVNAASPYRERTGLNDDCDDDWCLTLPNSRNIVQRTALALGDSAAATRLLQGLTDNQNPVLIQNYVTPTIQAHIELNNGNPAKAIDVLKAALPYDLAIAEFSSLQPAYARGLAYLQFRKGRKPPGNSRNSSTTRVGSSIRSSARWHASSALARAC